MRVVIRTISLTQAIPELVPAFRQLGADLPDHVEMDAAPTEDALWHASLREKYPDYWNGLTITEWYIFAALAKEPQGVERKELKVFTHVGFVGIDEYDEIKTSNVVDVHVKNLRKHLYRLGNRHNIVTKRGWGYLMTEGPLTLSGNMKPSDMTKWNKRVVHRVKELNDGGKIIQPRWRKAIGQLNPVEFGYLKEMKMDDIPIETVMERLRLTESEVLKAWNASGFDEYVKNFHRKNLVSRA